MRKAKFFLILSLCTLFGPTSDGAQPKGPKNTPNSRDAISKCVTGLLSAWSNLQKIAEDKEKEIYFEHPSLPNRTFRLHIQEDQISQGFFGKKIENEKQYMAFVELLPTDPKGTPILMSIATKIGSDGPNLSIEWISVVDYEKIMSLISKSMNGYRSGTTLHDAIGLNMVYGPKDETHAQMKLLHSYLGYAFRKRTITNEDVNTYFTIASATGRVSKMGYAILEFLSNQMHLGSTLSTHIANQPTIEALAKSTPWQDTVLGKMFSRAGFDLRERSGDENRGLEKVVMKKKNSSITFLTGK